MRGRSFEQMIAACLNRGRADAEARSAALRRAGLWPSGRGRYAPLIGAEGVAAGLLGHLGAAKPSQAVAASTLFSNLVEQVTLGRRFVKVLANLIADPSHAAGVQMILLNRVGPSAQIIGRDGSTRHFARQADDESAAAPTPVMAGEAGFISGELLLLLASEISAHPARDAKAQSPARVQPDPVRQSLPVA